MSSPIRPEEYAQVSTILRQKGSTVYTVTPEQTVYEAIDLMNEKNIGAVLIVEGDELIGILSERDCARRLALEGHDARQTKVTELATKVVYTVTPQTTIRQCMEMMTDRRVRHLPVIDQGKLVGIVSLGDLVKWLIDALNAKVEQLESYISGQYPC